MSSANVTIAHNVYFDGNVQSLGLDTEKGKATVGVMKKGTYVFSTSSAEKMVVVSGILSAKMSGGEWLTYNQGDAFDVAANASFEVKCEADVAYICYYN
jgi:purine/pyrimidine-nucleoside phosphorylase